MVDTILDNLSLRTQRKGELRLEIDAATTTEILERFLDGIKKILQLKEIESSSVVLENISRNSISINGDYFTAPFTQDEFNTIKEKINFSVLKLMESMQVKVAGADVLITGQGQHS